MKIHFQYSLPRRRDAESTISSRHIATEEFSHIRRGNDQPESQRAATRDATRQAPRATPRVPQHAPFNFSGRVRYPRTRWTLWTGANVVRREPDVDLLHNSSLMRRARDRDRVYELVTTRPRAMVGYCSCGVACTSAYAKALRAHRRRRRSSAGPDIENKRFPEAGARAKGGTSSSTASARTTTPHIGDLDGNHPGTARRFASRTGRPRGWTPRPACRAPAHSALGPDIDTAMFADAAKKLFGAGGEGGNGRRRPAPSSARRPERAGRGAGAEGDGAVGAVPPPNVRTITVAPSTLVVLVPSPGSSATARPHQLDVNHAAQVCRPRHGDG